MSKKHLGSLVEKKIVFKNQLSQRAKSFYGIEESK